MKVKILLNLGHDLPDYRQDEEVDVDEEVGNRLIHLGVARQLTPGPARAAQSPKDKYKPKSAGKSKDD